MTRAPSWVACTVAWRASAISVGSADPVSSAVCSAAANRSRTHDAAAGPGFEVGQLDEEALAVAYDAVDDPIRCFAGDRGELVERPPHDTECEPGVTGRRKAHHTELVDRASPPLHRCEEVKGRARRHPHVVDRVVPAGGALEPEHVPVPREPRLRGRHRPEEQLRVGAVGRLGHYAGGDPSRMPYSAAEVVVAGDPVAVTVRGGDAVGCKLTGRERHTVGEQSVREVVGRPRPEERGRGRVRHQAPARGAVAREISHEHVDGLHHRGFEPAHRARRHHRVQTRGDQRVDGCLGHRLISASRALRSTNSNRSRAVSRSVVIPRASRIRQPARSSPASAERRCHARESTARIVSGSWAPVIGKRPSTTKKGTPVIPISSARASSARTASL